MLKSVRVSLPTGRGIFARSSLENCLKRKGLSSTNLMHSLLKLCFSRYHAHNHFVCAPLFFNHFFFFLFISFLQEETIVEVSLTPVQRQFYRAIFEKNTQFLFKGARPVHAPSLMNIMMELRKVNGGPLEHCLFALPDACLAFCEDYNKKIRKVFQSRLYLLYCIFCIFCMRRW